MLALLELQRALSAAVLLDGAQRETLAGLTEELGLDPALLAIYRHSARSTLTAALVLSFPAVRLLVGEGFFDAAADEFITAHAPAGACLNDYGDEFPHFLAQFPPAATLPYLADVAQLEWAVNRALHAEDVPPLALESLSALDPAGIASLRFTQHPAVSVLRLATPAEAIWRAVLSQDEQAIAALDVNAGPVWLLIERAVAGVAVHRLGTVDGRFMQRLCEGEPLHNVLDGAGNAAFESVLAEHLAAGRFMSVHL